MKGSIFKFGMKLLALFGLFIALYPAFIVLKYFLFGTYGGVLEYLLPLLSMYLGLTVTALLCKREYYFTTRLISYIAVIIPVILSGLVFLRLGQARGLVDMATVGVFYIIGSVNYPRQYFEALSNKALYSDVILFVVLMILTSAVPVLNPVKNVVFIFVIIYIPIAMLIKSEENIDTVFLFRGIELPEVQKSIRKENSKSIFLLYAVILVLFNIKDLLAALLKVIMIAYVKTTIFILFLISKLFIIGQSESEKKAPGTQPQLPFEPGESNKIADYIFLALFTAIIIYAVYKLIPKLIKAIKKLIEFIKAKLSKLIKLKENKYDDSECVEIVEITKHITQDKFKRKKKVNLFNLLKKTTDPEKRVRLIYQIILKELAGKGIEVASSDTTGQIVKKTGELGNVEGDMETVTAIYEKVRYGEKSPEYEALKSMEAGYERITGKQKI